MGAENSENCISVPSIFDRHCSCLSDVTNGLYLYDLNLIHVGLTQTHHNRNEHA